MSTIGLNVQQIPSALDSMAAIRADFSIASMSQLHESAKGWGIPFRNRESRPYRTARDAQAAVLYGKFLHFADVLHAFQVEQTSDFTVADFTGNVRCSWLVR